MQPIVQNITFVRGDTLQFDVHLTDVEATMESMFFSAKKSATDDAYAFQKSLGDGITEVQENVYRVRVAPEDTAQLPAGTYVHDLQIGLGADIFTIMTGKIKLQQDVTEG